MSNGYVRLVSVPERFGSELLVGKTEELVGLEISIMGSCSGGEESYLVCMESLLTSMRAKFPERFQEYDRLCEERIRKHQEMSGRGYTLERVRSPLDEYFSGGFCPYCVSIQKSLCEAGQAGVLA